MLLHRKGTLKCTFYTIHTWHCLKVYTTQGTFHDFLEFHFESVDFSLCGHWLAAVLEVMYGETCTDILIGSHYMLLSHTVSLGQPLHKKRQDLVQCRHLSCSFPQEVLGYCNMHTCGRLPHDCCMYCIRYHEIQRSKLTYTCTCTCSLMIEEGSGTARLPNVFFSPETLGN